MIPKKNQIVLASVAAQNAQGAATSDYEREMANAMFWLCQFLKTDAEEKERGF